MVFVIHVTPNLAGWFVNKNDIACIWLVRYFTVEIETFHSSRTVYINFSRILTVVAVWNCCSLLNFVKIFVKLIVLSEIDKIHRVTLLIHVSADRKCTVNK